MARPDPTVVEEAFAALLDADSAERTAVLDFAGRISARNSSRSSPHDSGSGLIVLHTATLTDPTPFTADSSDLAPFDAGTRVGEISRDFREPFFLRSITGSIPAGMHDRGVRLS